MQPVRSVLQRTIATVTVDSPDNRNALSAAVVDGLADALARAGADPSVRAVVLTHTGSVFCAGADLRELASEGGPEAGTRRVIDLLRAVVELEKPVIARIDGAVRAGGIGLVGACDVAIASNRASFAFTEVRLGVAPAMISLTTLGAMTARAASRYYLTGETFDAPAAVAAGLLTAVADDLDAELDRVTDAVRQCSPQGLAATKSLLTADALSAFDARAADLQALSARLFATDEAREGIAAFLQKRPARWATQ